MNRAAPASGLVPVYLFDDGTKIYRMVSEDGIYKHRPQFDVNEYAYFWHDGQRPSMAMVALVWPDHKLKIHSAEIRTDAGSSNFKFMTLSQPYWREFARQLFSEANDEWSVPFRFPSPVEIPDGFRDRVLQVSETYRASIRTAQRAYMGRPTPQNHTEVQRIAKEMMKSLVEGVDPGILTLEIDIRQDILAQGTYTRFIFKLNFHRYHREGVRRSIFVSFHVDQGWHTKSSAMSHSHGQTLLDVWDAMVAQENANGFHFESSSNLDDWWRRETRPGQLLFDLESYMLLDTRLPLLYPRDDFLIWLREAGSSMALAPGDAS